MEEPVEELSGWVRAETLEVSDVAPPPTERPVDVNRVRRTLAYSSVGLFAMTLVFGFVSALVGEAAWERAKMLIQIAVPIETLLIGATAGHYFPGVPTIRVLPPD
jgi:hypothetical protein